MSLSGARQVVAAALSALVVGSLCGCQSVASTSSSTLVRVIDASSNAQAVDAYVGQTEIASNIGAGSVSNYAILGPQQAQVTIDPTGTTKPAATLSGSFLAGQQHSIFLADSGSSFTASILTDENTPAPSGQFAVRFLQAAPSVGSVDIYFVLPSDVTTTSTTSTTTGVTTSTTTFPATNPVASALAAGQNTGYIDLPAGTYDLIVTEAGSTKPIYLGTSTVYATGQVQTVLLIGQKIGAMPLNVIASSDVN
jgi:hypothetical protein